jgi:hypothetical protein
MRARILSSLVCLGILVLALAGASSAKGESAQSILFSSQEKGLGVEYQISTAANPEMDRYKPAAVYNSYNHQTLVVWHRHNGSSFFIEGRLLDSAGKPIGSGPTIFASGQTPVYQPAVAYNAFDKQYLVVWMRNTNLDGKTYEIWGKVLNPNLTESRSEFQVIAPSANHSLWSPRVAWNRIMNEYMIVQNSYEISAWPALVPDSIIQETLISNGDPVGHIVVIYNTPSNLIYPSQVDLVYADDVDHGKFMWVWSQVKPGTADHDIWAANIDAYTGGYLPTLQPFPIDTSTTDQEYPRIATNGADDYMLVWQELVGDADNDWDVRGREINQVGTFAGDLHIIAGYGATDETDPFVAAWPGSTHTYVVGYERESDTGQGIWLAYYDNGANVISAANYIFWLDTFAASDYGFWTNSYPSGVVAGASLQFAYQGISNTPGDHTQIYSRSWTPFQVYLPMLRK